MNVAAKSGNDSGGNGRLNAADLRPYQAAAISAARDAIRSGIRSLLLVAPCGAGKTVLFAEIIRLATARGKSVLVLVHRRELLQQAVKHLVRVGLNASTIIDGRIYGVTPTAVTVASIDTLRRFNQDSLPKADIVIADECHHATSASWRSLLALYPDSFLLGFTATPQRADGSPLGDIFQRLHVVAHTDDLIRDGYLVPPIVWSPPKQQQGLAERADRAYLEHGQGRRGIIFCANVGHSERVAAALVTAGIRAEHVDGSMSDSLRDAALQRFASGETIVITNANLIGEGFDMPACKLVIIARGCTSPVYWIQACGRAMRPDDSGLADALILDLRGAVHAHGLPDARREFSLAGKPIRLAANGPAIRQCRACGYVFAPRDTCPRCGHATPAPKDPAVSRAELARIHQTHTPNERRAYFQAMLQRCRQNGWNPRQAAVLFKNRYGAWPERSKPA